MPGKRIIVGLMSWVALIAMVSCAKSNFLEQKPNTTSYEPETLEELQELLDNEKLINQHAYLGILSGDEYYYTDPFTSSIPASEKNAYIWATKIFGADETVTDWDVLYQQVNYANQVLEKIKDIPVTALNKSLYNTVKGTALFVRGYAFYNVAQVFAMPYDKSSAQQDWGIPLRLGVDVMEKSKRATMQQTYEQIIQDLEAATALLPATTLRRNRPSTAAAWAMLARTWLSMRVYEKAGAAADSSLHLHDALLNFNELNLQSDNPFSSTNPEIIYLGRMDPRATSLLVGFASRGCFIAPALYAAYAPGDLRRSLFFKTMTGSAVPKGSYYGELTFFTGLATDEMYLIRAESYARTGKPAAALADLNTLLRRRWQPGLFTPLTIANTPDVLNTTIRERWKELVLRGQRWTDIRRLNKEGKGMVLSRLLYGQTFLLPPNDRRYALPIPDKVIELSGMPQNPR